MGRRYQEHTGLSVDVTSSAFLPYWYKPDGQAIREIVYGSPTNPVAWDTRVTMA
jgi:hypothetical protein